MDKNDKLFGKWKDIIMLLLAFVLTTIGGSLIGYYVQNRSWENEHEQNALQVEIQRSETIYREVSELMYERLYIMRKLYWAYDDKKEINIIDERWENYNEVLYKWNKLISMYYGLVEVHFGKKMKNILSEKIHHKFKYIGKDLERIKSLESIPKKKLAKIDSELEQIDFVLYDFNIKLIKAINEENVGKYIK